MFLYKTVFVFTFAIFVELPMCCKCSLQEEEVMRWTNELGNELWNLGKTITKYQEIEGKYKYLNAQVEKKDPEKLLTEVVADIERMMDRKMDAVVCISQKAEEEAENFVYNDTDALYTYYSSKHSSIFGEAPLKLPDSIVNNSAMYKELVLNNDTHFYNLAVNTSHSSVHVPTNIYDRHMEPALAIQWSEALDEVFVQNYNSDPALSWQYFGSTSGIMRHYPAKRWENLHSEDDVDVFDCRIRSWFIEAATCTKDVVILLDNSGSMDGMGKHIGAFTAHSILKTFSNNDFINVLNYSSWINYTVPCYKDKLVQATEENIRVFKDAIWELEPAEKTDLEKALVEAFNLLKKYREIRGCSETSDHCNQAIMIITDGVSKNFSDIVIKHNFLSNGAKKPVRIFTYLVGKEVANAPETQWLSCANRGYYTHVQTLEQVTGAVLQYINVIARPLVLQAKEHPASWTHAYQDLTYDDANDNVINEPYRLLTAVAVPAFDRNANRNNVSKTANLLGVAGTDVPIADIEKLTLPYKIGVNAYAFIVSNNGYVLMHPDLRPLYRGIINQNFNSIDLTEVEQLDNDLPPREIDDTLYELRDSLVMGRRGSIHNVSIKYHYDNMSRVSREQYDYYFAPIKNTPFSIALTFPTKYGNYSLDVGDEISKNRHTGANITDFFKGTNWKIHPNWVYCKYHYLEGHEFKTPEDEMLHFLGKMYNADFIWEKQYEAATEDEDLENVECGRKTHEDSDYYCDRQLVQRLVFDAKNTLSAFQGPQLYRGGETPLFEMFNATLRFVATMSGLTRWEYISEEDENNTKKEFGDYHSQAIDETWYKSAVIQHQYDRESFVYSVPFDAEDNEELLVTGSYAIFPSDAGLEAPGSVVGFQFSHKYLKKRVVELTNKVSNQCPECGICSTTLECYVIDSSGYIIVSENNNDTGRFFGEIEGDIMDSMLSRGIFEKVTIYDFQAICIRDDHGMNAGNIMSTPLEYFQSVVNWCVLKITWLAIDFHFSDLWATIHTYAQNYSIEDSVLTNETEPAASMKPKNVESKKDEDEEEDEEDYWDYCEQERDLYILQQNASLPGEIYHSRMYYIKKIPFSNLLFVAINSTMPRIDPVVHTTATRIIQYKNETVYPCQKLNLNDLSRRRLTGCFNEHPKEREITACGKATSVTISSVSMILPLFLTLSVAYSILKPSQ